MKPPAAGPMIEATPKAAPIMPWYFPRSRGETMSPMIAWESGCMVPIPTPWTTRAAIRKAKFGASPESAEPKLKTTIPPM